MGKRPNRGRGGRQDHKRQRSNDNTRSAYADIIRENPSFEAYYKLQKIVPEEDWEAFMTTLRTPLPATFRITGTRETAHDLRKAIETHFFPLITAVTMDGTPLEPPRPLSWYPDGLAWHMDFTRNILRRADALKKFHQFIVSENEQGNITRQEAVSMIPPLLLDVQPHHKVLDMCAAPGSKTAQLIELLHADSTTIPSGLVVANDVDNKRCYMLVHQTKRLQSPNFLITNHDAALYPSFYTAPKPGSTEKEVLVYDRILCDVPCSGDGTLRKNPVVWTRWSPVLGPGLHRLQTRILDRGIQLLAVGGLLVYSTCSFNPVENEAVVAALLQKYPHSLELVDVSAQLPNLKRRAGLHSWALQDTKGASLNTYDDVPAEKRQKYRKTMFPPSAETAAALHLERCVRILPQDQDTGGFFIAAIRKHSALGRKDRDRAAAGAAAAAAGEDDADDAAADDAAADAAVAVDADEVAGEDDEAAGMDDGETAPEPTEGGAGGAAGADEGKTRGYKEDPFLFLAEDNVNVKEIKEFYGLKPEFPSDLLLTRSSVDKARHIYLVSPTIRELILNNETSNLRIINTGVKVLTRSESDAVSCSYRLCTEGINVFFPFMQKRLVAASLADAKLLLIRDVPGFREFQPDVQQALEKCGEGSVVLNCTAAEGEAGPPMPLLGWRGRHTLRCLVAKPERVHYKVLLGILPKDEPAPAKADGDAKGKKDDAAPAGSAVATAPSEAAAPAAALAAEAAVAAPAAVDASSVAGASVSSGPAQEPAPME
eukprot:m.232176 g.232176  ORF g.232176 m.232176 type:complete len:769 (+) comp12310_c0_seq1:46-2352(+)